MSAFIAAIGGKWLVGALAALAALVAVFFKGRSSGKAAGQQEAAGKVQEAQQEAVQARGDAAAATAVAEAIQTRQRADSAAAAIPEDQLDAELAKRGILRKEGGQ
jgi:hypothetical protein